MIILPLSAFVVCHPVRYLRVWGGHVIIIVYLFYNYYLLGFTYTNIYNNRTNIQV